MDAHIHLKAHTNTYIYIYIYMYIYICACGVLGYLIISYVKHTREFLSCPVLLLSNFTNIMCVYI